MTAATAHGTGAGAWAGSTVAVVGGGIAGLSAAWALSSAEPGVRVVVLESDERLGGKLRTGAIGGRAVDLGPDAFLARRPEAVELCRELGLGDELVAPGSRTAYVWARGDCAGSRPAWCSVCRPGWGPWPGRGSSRLSVRRALPSTSWRGPRGAPRPAGDTTGPWPRSPEGAWDDR